MMHWEPPKTEEDWLECLSDYVDGELPRAACLALEEHLQSETKRREQLRSLRASLDVLHQWRIDASGPSADFLHKAQVECEAQAPWGHIRAGSAFRRWAPCAAAFLIGLAVGVFCAALRYGTPEPTQTIVVKSDVVNLTVSPEQGERLLREAAASDLTAELRGLIRAGDLGAARAALRVLLTNYGDTNAVRSLREDPRWPLAMGQYGEPERT